MNKENGPIVIKIGGSTLGTHDTTLKDLSELQKEGYSIVIVHGGGKVISQWMERQGGLPHFIRGNRVTDSQSLDIVTAVLTGLINKQLVASLVSLKAKVVGLSGVDGGMLECKLSETKELGLVGEVTSVDPYALETLMASGFMPLIAPIGFHSNDDSKLSGSLLNINGDSVTGNVAKSLNASRLIFLTDVAGVMDNSGRLIPRLSKRQARMLIESGVVKGGMIPKLEACLKASQSLAYANIIDGRDGGALRQCIEGSNLGTRIELN
jgi:acetylglutamate kinase